MRIIGKLARDRILDLTLYLLTVERERGGSKWQRLANQRELLDVSERYNP